MMDLGVPVSGSMASSVAMVTLAVTYVLKRFVLPKMDASMIACIGGTLATVASCVAGPDVSLGTAVASGIAGTAGAGLVYDKVAGPVVGGLGGKLWSFFAEKIAPKKAGK